MRILITVLLSATFCSQAIADLVILRTGDRVSGTVADRELVRTQRGTLESIGVLPDSGSVLQRYESGSIDYVILEDGDSRDIVDMQQQLPGQRRMRPSPYRTDGGALVPEPSSPSGLPLILLGGVMGAVGAAVKLGDEKLEVTNSSVDYSEKSYNSANYALMGVGGALVLIGLVRESESKSSSDGSVGIRFDPLRQEGALAYHLAIP